MIRRSPMTRLVSQRALRTIFALLLLIMIVFLTEIFTSELESVIRNGGGALDFAVILLLKSPEIVDFALPIVLFLGLYLAITGARNDNELVICAAAGERWQKIPRIGLLIGMFGLVLSFLFSGIVTPFSAYLLRLTYYELHASRILTALTDPEERAYLREIDERTFIATPAEEGTSGNGSLFIYEPQPRGGWNVSQAEDWSVDGPDENGAYHVELHRYREYRGGPGAAPSGPDAPSRLGATSPLDFARINVQTLNMEFQVGDVIQAADDARRFSERYIFQSDGPLRGRTVERESGEQVAAPTRRFGEMLARGLMCPVAAAIAVAAAAFAGTRKGRYVALPGGVVAVLAGDVFSRAFIGDAAALGYPAFWPTALAVAAVGLALPLGYVWLRAELIVAPPRNQT